MQKAINLFFEVTKNTGSISRTFGKTHDEFLKSISEALSSLDKLEIESITRGLLTLLDKKILSGSDVMILAARGFAATINELMRKRALQDGQPPMDLPSFFRAILGELEYMESIENLSDGGLIIKMGDLEDVNNLKTFLGEGSTTPKNYEEFNEEGSNQDIDES